MTILPLVTAFNGLDTLKTPAKTYLFQDHDPVETTAIAANMVESLYYYKGLGISANQLGLPWRIFAMRGAEYDIVCFNPELVSGGNEQVRLEEGCLSFPSLFLKINRWKTVRVRFADPEGFTDAFTYTGMTARVFQHELEHLEGSFFFDGANRLHLERAMRQAKNKGHDYNALGLMKYARK